MFVVNSFRRWFVLQEVWNIALSAGFVFTRVLKISIISAFFVARIDTPFLADGVGRVGPVDLDGIELCFRKDLLLHEAHRHAYIERFGLLCLLKLKCGDTFGRRANSNWRVLFVMALMPWLRKYRVREGDSNNEPSIFQAEEGVVPTMGGDPMSMLVTSDLLARIKELKTINKKLEEQNKKLQEMSLSKGNINSLPSVIRNYFKFLGGDM